MQNPGSLGRKMAKLSLETGVSKQPGDRGHDGTGENQRGCNTGVGSSLCNGRRSQ